MKDIKQQNFSKLSQAHTPISTSYLAQQLLNEVLSAFNPPCPKPTRSDQNKVQVLSQILKAKILKNKYKKMIPNKNRLSSHITLPLLMHAVAHQDRKETILGRHSHSNQYKNKKSLSLKYDRVSKLQEEKQQYNLTDSQRIIHNLREQKIKSVSKKQVPKIYKYPSLTRFSKYNKQTGRIILKQSSRRTKKDEPLIFYNYKGQLDTLNQSQNHKINKGVIDIKKSVGCVKNQNFQSPYYETLILKEKSKSISLIQDNTCMFSFGRNNRSMQQQLDIQIKNNIQSLISSQDNLIQLKS